MAQPKVSIVLGTYNRIDYLKKTIQTVRSEINTFALEAEIIVIDGGSSDGTLNWLVKQKDIITITQHNRGTWLGKSIKRRSWGYFMNLGFKCAQGKYVCMISDDCLVVPNAISSGIKLFDERLSQGKKLGALAFYWRNWPIDKDYYVGLTLGKRMFVNHGLYLREALESVNFIDEDSYHFYHADGDLMLRVNEQGYSCEDSPNSYIEHYADANTQVRASNMEKQAVDWKFYLKRWDKLVSASDGFSGGWNYKSFDDTSKTGDNFRLLYFKDSIKRPFKKVFAKIVG